MLKGISALILTGVGVLKKYKKWTVVVTFLLGCQAAGGISNIGFNLKSLWSFATTKQHVFAITMQLT